MFILCRTVHEELHCGVFDDRPFGTYSTDQTDQPWLKDLLNLSSQDIKGYHHQMKPIINHRVIVLASRVQKDQAYAKTASEFKAEKVSYIELRGRATNFD
jgi:hypothetical protein